MGFERERHIKLWTFEDEDVELEYFGKVKVGDGKFYTSLRERLEVANVLDLWFEFWDVEDTSRIRKKIKSLKDIFEDIHVMPLAVGKCDGNKH